MDRKLGRLAILAALVGCSPTPPTPPAAPADPAPTPAREQHRALVGIEIGEPRLVAECSKERAYGTVMYTSPSKVYPCFKEYGGTSDAIKEKASWEYGPQHEGMRDIQLDPASLPRGVETEARALVIGEAIEGLDLHTDPDMQEQIFKQLTSKFGPPDQANVSELQNPMGAQFQGIEASWRFQAIRLTYYGRLDLETGLLIARSPAGQAWLDARSEKRAAGF